MLRLVRPPQLDLFGWSLLAAAAIASNLLYYAAPADPAIGIAAGLAQLLLLTAASYAVIRRMTGVARPLAGAASFGRYLVLSLALLLPLLLLFLALFLMQRGEPLPIERQWLASLLAVAVAQIVVLRLLAGAAALATGAPFAALIPLWHAQRGQVWPLILAYCALVLPFDAIETALALLGERLALPVRALAALAAIEGLAHAIVIALTAALAVAAWRDAGGALREPGRTR